MVDNCKNLSPGVVPSLYQWEAKRREAVEIGDDCHVMVVGPVVGIVATGQ